MLFGVGAIIFALINIVRAKDNKDSGLHRFISMSLKAFTLCSFYSDGANRVLNNDWGGLMDIMHSMSNVLWVCTIISILLNSYSLFKERKREIQSY